MAARPLTAEPRRIQDLGRIAREGLAGGGGALPCRDQLEGAFNADLSHNRVHAGPRAQAACDTMGAAAYTQTPYQRLCATGVLSAAAHHEIEALYQSLNPLQLRRDLERELDRLWTLAAPDPHRPEGNTEIAPPPNPRSWRRLVLLCHES